VRRVAIACAAWITFAPSAFADDVVVVHVDADGAAELQVETRATNGVTTWKPLCTTPCMTRAPADAVVRLAGSGVTPSSTFTLGDREMFLKAHVRSETRVTTGFAVAGTGFVAIGVGVITGLASALWGVTTHDDACAYVGGCHPYDLSGPIATSVVAGVVVVVGAILAVAGFRLMRASRLEPRITF